MSGDEHLACIVFTALRRPPIIVALALLALAIGALMARGRGCRLAELRGNVRELTVTPPGLLWIEAPAQPGTAQTELRYLPWGAHTAPTTLLKAYDIRSLAVHGDTVYALIETAAGDATGQLVAQPIGTGAPTVLRSDLHSPQGLVVTDVSICWTESRAAPVAGIAHAPIMGQLAAIRLAPVHSAPGGQSPVEGQPQLLAMAESAEAHYGGQLLGAREGCIYWTEYLATRTSGVRTFFRRAAESGGGEPETLGLAKGIHQAALAAKELYWTAGSEEMAMPGGGRVVRRLALQGGTAETLTDWLPAAGALLVDDGRAFYAGGGWFWSVPRALAKPVACSRCNVMMPGQVVLAGGSLMGTDLRGKEKGLFRVPVSYRGRLTAALPGMARRAARQGGETP